MATSSSSEQEGRQGRPRPRLWIDWIGVVLSLIIIAFIAADRDRMQLPGYPVALFWVSLALAGLAAILLAPPVFGRLSAWGRLGGLLTLVVSFVVMTNEREEAFQAYMKTPAGRQEEARVVARAKQSVAEANERQAAWAASPEGKAQLEKDRTERTIADLADAKQKLEELNVRLERCFTGWGHRLPDLENPVKESLHNPAAFEHIETVVIVPDSDSNNVVMRFRAENGFGALRTGQVLAQLIADDCSVQNIRELNIE